MTEQVSHVVWCTLEIATYPKKDIGVDCIFTATFNPGSLTVGFMNAGVLLRKVLQTPSGGRSSPLTEMIIPLTTILTLLFFLALRYFYFRVSKKTLHDTRIIKSGSRIGLLVQKVVKAWSILTHKYLNMSLWDVVIYSVVVPYMVFDGVVMWFFVIITPSDGFAPFDQLWTADVADSPTTALNMVLAVAAARPDDADLGPAA